MNEFELISKKDLLKYFNISYGQLYRWKRENLIPEAWFIKKSSFTGQETFFPKEKILKRINDILKLKDQYSLEELANMISPELTRKVFDIDELHDIPEINSNIIENFKNIFHKKYFSFIELLFIYSIGKMGSNYNLNSKDFNNAAKSIESWVKSIKDTSYKLIILSKENDILFIMAGQDSRLLFDARINVMESIDLEEAAKDLNMVLNDIYKEV